MTAATNTLPRISARGGLTPTRAVTEKMMIDPENPPGRAADGGRLPPAANNFGDFVRFLEDGQFDAELTEALKELAGEMANQAIDSGGKSKGKLTITFDFALEGRVFTIASNHKVAVPPAKRPKSVLWTTEDMRFTPSNPHQGLLFGVREVGGAGGLRDVG